MIVMCFGYYKITNLKKCVSNYEWFVKTWVISFYLKITHYNVKLFFFYIFVCGIYIFKNINWKSQVFI